MIFCNLGSGSKGNSSYIQAENTSVLIDQGFSGKQVCHRMQMRNLHPEFISAIVLTHDHGDHSKGIGIFARKYNIPVYMTSINKSYLHDKFLKNVVVRTFTSGNIFKIGTLTFKSFHIPHDAVDPVGYIVSSGNSHIMHLTDIGKPVQSVICQINDYDFDLIFLESNHDPMMLKTGPYPLQLQMRIKSRDGHLSNSESLELFKQIDNNTKLKHLILGHLSVENNCQDIVSNIFKKFKTESNHDYSLTIAKQDTPTEIFEL